MINQNTKKLEKSLTIIINNFKDYCRVERGHRPITINNEIKAVQTFFKRCDISSIEQLLPEKFKEFFYTQVKEHSWSANNQRNYWTYLNCFITWCISQRIVNFKKNPMLSLGKPRKPKIVPRRISKEQLNELFTRCNTYPWKYKINRARNVAIFATFMYTGMRINELINLRVEDISLSGRTILIREGKGGGTRVVKITYEFKRFLEDYEYHINRLDIQRDYYFTTIGDYKKMTHKTIYGFTKILSKDTGIFFTPHRLRHTFASIALEQKIPVASISRAMGHKSIVYTETYLAPEINIMLSHFDEYSPLCN